MMSNALQMAEFMDCFWGHMYTGYTDEVNGKCWTGEQQEGRKGEFCSIKMWDVLRQSGW